MCSDSEEHSAVGAFRDEVVGQVSVLLPPTPFPVDPVRSTYETLYSLLLFSIPTTHASFSPSIPGN